MIVVEPRVVQKPSQHYVGKRDVIEMSAQPQFIPNAIGEVMAWASTNAELAGQPPFMRFWCIDMPGRMDVEIGVPVRNAVEPGAGLTAGTLPAGRYAALEYANIAEGIAGNAHLLQWMAKEGHTADSWSAPEGEAFAARLEAYLSDPSTEPDPAKWVTEVAILLKGES